MTQVEHDFSWNVFTSTVFFLLLGNSSMTFVISSSWNSRKVYFSLLLKIVFDRLVFEVFFSIGIHPMQVSTVLRGIESQEKKAPKIKHIGNLFTKNLHFKGVNSRLKCHLDHRSKESIV